MCFKWGTSAVLGVLRVAAYFCSLISFSLVIIFDNISTWRESCPQNEDFTIFPTHAINIDTSISTISYLRDVAPGLHSPILFYNSWWYSLSTEEYWTTPGVVYYIHLLPLASLPTCYMVSSVVSHHSNTLLGNSPDSVMSILGLCIITRVDFLVSSVS